MRAKVMQKVPTSGPKVIQHRATTAKLDFQTIIELIETRFKLIPEMDCFPKWLIPSKKKK